MQRLLTAIFAFLSLYTTSYADTTRVAKPAFSMSLTFGVWNARDYHADGRVQIDHLGARYALGGRVSGSEFRPPTSFSVEENDPVVQPESALSSVEEYFLQYGRRFKIPGGSVTLSTGIGMATFDEAIYTYIYREQRAYDWWFLWWHGSGIDHYDHYQTQIIAHYEPFVPIDMEICLHFSRLIGLTFQGYTSIGAHSSSGVNLGISFGNLE